MPLTRMADDPTDDRLRLASALERERRRLIRFVERKLWGDDGAEAEDIVSDVTVRLLERADLLAGVEDMTAYLYGALARGVIDFFRKRQRGGALSAPLEGAEDIADTAIGPDGLFADKERRERLCRALVKLPPAEHAVWVATEIEGLSFKALAERWREPIGTLLSRKSRAAQHLREILAEGGD